MGLYLHTFSLAVEPFRIRLLRPNTHWKQYVVHIGARPVNHGVGAIFKELEPLSPEVEPFCAPIALVVNALEVVYRPPRYPPHAFSHSSVSSGSVLFQQDSFRADTI